MSNAIRRRIRTRIARLRGPAADRGANSIEYAGIVILVAGIILAIRALGLDSMISGAIANAVSAVLGG
ncbi:hypothetical protein [Streptomyces reniochalinae]|uniref:Flp family type IVb pilin n=1 Tax=Streptomyces reniochalinae TaxID=2250578 RepID=A0A367EZT6_9ACTN|nr:hypothetical protein [Streptomyces reniochalinae]RCG22700.1 hypothetical protein DQ392_06625 [Streptomyces reniochalinae]